CQKAVVIEGEADLEKVDLDQDICVVSQTTMQETAYKQLCATLAKRKKLHDKKNILKNKGKTLEIFDTICYTTSERQKNAIRLGQICNFVLVFGSAQSSNTKQLYHICSQYTVSYWVDGWRIVATNDTQAFQGNQGTACTSLVSQQTTDKQNLKNIKFPPHTVVGMIAGASTPKESVMEVVRYMSKEFATASSVEFLEGLEETFVKYDIGKRIKGTVIGVSKKGVSLDIGGKLDGLIKTEDFEEMGKVFDPSKYPVGATVEAVIISQKDPETNCILLSKRRVDKQKAGDKLVEAIRDEQEFDITVEEDIKGGVTGKYGSYSVFVPASHVSEYFTKDLKQFVGKTLRVVAIEIDDRKSKIIASAKKPLMKDKKERESEFWSQVQPGMIVGGTVKRFNNFGAFVSVGGIDCLAHNTDLSWNKISNPANVLKLGESYDFLVLAMDKEKGRVSLGMKQLKEDPFLEAIERYPVGSDAVGKISRIVPYGAFVELEKGVDGLVHVSEAAHGFVKNINDILKVGQETKVRVLGIDPNAKKINLSIKATQDAPVQTDNADSTPRKGKGKETPAESATEQWSDQDTAINPFADLLKDVK
ncbi:MAG: S1 RNA-binding domain-containing protein, partial [Firmicutes bacterium]|nr:S1 RNA-binding domain-containing protein [Bacillota bacterium]